MRGQDLGVFWTGGRVLAEAILAPEWCCRPRPRSQGSAVFVGAIWADARHVACEAGAPIVKVIHEKREDASHVPGGKPRGPRREDEGKWAVTTFSVVRKSKTIDSCRTVSSRR